jgi:hypothetical protein
MLVLKCESGLSVGLLLDKETEVLEHMLKKKQVFELYPWGHNCVRTRIVWPQSSSLLPPVFLLCNAGQI